MLALQTTGPIDPSIMVAPSFPTPIPTFPLVTYRNAEAVPELGPMFSESKGCQIPDRGMVVLTYKMLLPVPSIRGGGVGAGGESGDPHMPAEHNHVSVIPSPL